MHTLSSFPMVSPAEFEQGCEDIAELFDSIHLPERGDKSIALKTCNGLKYLRISKPFNVSDKTTQSSDIDVEEQIEEDDEEAFSHPNVQQAHIEWDVIYSSSYQVPVIYFRIKDSSYRFPPNMETLRCIIPEQYKSQIESHGLMGGITITDHPFTNTPVFFLHPCQTADVLASSVGTKTEITPTEYLLLFMTGMGRYMQLDLPLSLAETLRKHSLRE
ncbi:hypothetical protein BDV96DRAFT_163607 [Lophiotrema nucula]|uniref:Ubiquitin-like-conjugating enzyme ATG10 n=1 Tax=Lophiotrema nucula TaxID=690887 RepID=A0A6A5Z0U5_9PLEO|nr:hypothetical protein BDV96DRAFT_163607 [Lophiotrema nucula]